MAEVINIRSADFDDVSEETVTTGECSVCHKFLICQGIYGFPVICPYCCSKLDNGTDSREWIIEIMRKAG